jgi:hypothetical protein
MTTRPDLTAARDALLAKFTTDWDIDPWGEYESARARLADDLDNLIALARAEAGVSVEALLDAWEAQEHPSIDAAIQAALAARSAGSGSRVEALDLHALAESAASQRALEVDAEYRALRAARPTPPPAVDGTRCAECGGVKDDVFHVPCLVGGPFHYVKTCHPFTPPTPDPAVDGTRVCGHARAEDGICGHTEQWEGHRSKAIVGGIHEFVPFTPPTPAPDRLQALEAALDHAEKNLGVIALTLTDHPEYPVKAADVDAARSLARFTAQDIRAARDLLAPDGEGSRS